MTPQDDPPEEGVRGELAQDRFVGEADATHWTTRAGRMLATAARRTGEWIGPHATLLITLIVGLAIIVGLTAVAAEVYDAVVDDDGVAGLDQPILDFMIAGRTPWLNDAATAFTDVAGVIVMPIIAVAAMLFLAIRRKSWTPVILILAAGGGSLLMTVVGKALVGRVRPDLSEAVPPYEYSPSFPSGHTLNAVVISGIIAYLLIIRQEHRWARWLTIAVAALFSLTVGATRVYLGHHWFTDVLAAFFLGAAWLTLVITAHRLYLTARERRTQDPPAAPDPAAPPRST